MDQLSPRELARFLEHLQRNPVAHLEEIQGIRTLEPYQRGIAQAIADHERTAIAACHDLGKSFTVSRIVLWAGSCFPHSKIITTAPTFNQVKQILWSEIRAGHAASKLPLGGQLNLTEWKIDSDWFAMGFTPRTEAGQTGGAQVGSSFQGFHARYIFVIFDEATGVPGQIWTQAEGLLTSGFVRFIAIGNPTDPNSEFARCFKSPSWHKIRLSCFDSPNLKANGIREMSDLLREIDYCRGLGDVAFQARMASYKLVQPYLLSLSWVIARAIEWGMDHPLFVSKVLGEFPKEGSNVLMPLSIVEKAQRRTYEPKTGEVLSLGIDVGRFGSDSSILTLLHGPKIVDRRVKVRADGDEVVGEAIAILRPYFDAHHRPQDAVICIDGTGVGASVVDGVNRAIRNKDLPPGVSVIDANFGEGFKYLGDPDRSDRKEAERLYANRKAKIFAELGKDLRENLVLTQDSVYLEELPTIIYRFDSKGRYVIESKEDYKKRTGRGSPDNSDSLALANEGRKFRSMVGQFVRQQSSGFTHAPGLRSGDRW